MSLLLAALLATAAADAPPATKPAAADKIRCKRFLETGSLVKSRKECHTEAEWDLLRREVKEERQRLQGPGIATGGGSGN